MTDETEAPSLLRNGLWENNPGLVQLLGLCPLLAVTTSLVNGLGLGLATLAVLVMSNALVSATRRLIRAEIRVPMYVLIIASLVTSIELCFEAWFPFLDRSLGIFIPLIVTNCTIVARAEAFASRNPLGPAVRDGLGMGLGFLGVLCALGAFRELAGSGTLFAGFDMLVPGAPPGGLAVGDSGFLLFLLPPGAFFGLALAVALKNWADQRRGRSRRFAARHRVS